MKIALIVSGASGVELADAFLRYLPDGIETHVVLSDNARTVALHEKTGITLHADNDIAAAIASGSFGVDATAVIPCSMNTLAKIACGIADTLASRAAAVAIKERKPLLLAPRELPFSPIALENMLKLSRLGVIIAPPVLGYYSDSRTLEEMERFLVGKWYDILGIENELYRRWGS
ncbi:UbiX family flavin prenyltransferase [Nitratifractor salsuginis]|uniref:Flavin prenyltransferase UbiX n=1 Tax=Nitratifractor salsuginis (strain DSM 16511 / JCM 12458 / E9I37-1) TaxID=749222 RepID=E6X367_NITSE|nr:UbiX family flavin prenyltransferase [Nitratifractor salsuginis]ADV46211.1 3-octaprenyl-4-hydroxybenzoate carboxy-lyase [Nitratifractor salsuginis DSM 16511]